MNKPRTVGNSLIDWDVNEENKRIVFLEHMYRCDGREDPAHPSHATYTGLWQNFCLNEAGRAMRDQWFERMEAADKYIRDNQKLNDATQRPFIAGFDD